jgi:hypothetical protein
VTLCQEAPEGKIVKMGGLTVDRTGDFRFSALAAGRYYLEVATAPFSSSYQNNPTYRRLFYGGATELESAKVIEVKAGQTDHLDIQLQPTPGFQIRGRIEAAANFPIVGAHRPADSASVELAFWDAQTQTFTMSQVPPAIYVVEAVWNGDGKQVRALVPVTIADADIDGLVIRPPGAGQSPIPFP